jgi:hypothetical protein
MIRGDQCNVMPREIDHPIESNVVIGSMG